MTSKNDVLLDFLTYFSSDIRQRRATLPIPPFLLGFTAITDHPRVGEVWPGYCLQSGMAQV
jgi:hypothetical protein